MATAKIPARDLVTVAEDGLRALYVATTHKAFDAAFESLFSKHLEVTLNGKKSTRTHLKKELWDEKHQERRGTVTFAGAVQASNSDEHPDDAGVVGLFLNATLALAPSGSLTAQSITASYRLSIIQDKSVEPTKDGEHPVPGDFEIRRVNVVDVVTKVETVF